VSTGNLATSSRATSTTPKSPNSFHTGNACHTPRALGLSCARQHTHPHLLPSHAKPQIKKRQRHTTHTRLSFFSFRVCVQQRHNVFIKPREIFTRSAVCFINAQRHKSSFTFTGGLDGYHRSALCTHTHTHIRPFNGL
jgi:hypothetical protein